MLHVATLLDVFNDTLFPLRLHLLVGAPATPTANRYEAIRTIRGRLTKVMCTFI
jgi:hypothetical protein